MDKYFCNPCGYIYDPVKGDPEHGIAPGTAFIDLRDDRIILRFMISLRRSPNE